MDVTESRWQIRKAKSTTFWGTAIEIKFGWESRVSESKMFV